MKIVHAADLHIDSPLLGLGRLEGAPVEAIRTATRAAFTALIDLCLEERASLLLLAGDVFDGDAQDYNSAIFFARQLSRLAEAGTQVVIAKGNHDAAAVMTREVPLPQHVHVLAHAAPETKRYDTLGVAVHGQSFRTRAVTENLARSYPPPVPGMLNFGVLHTNATGSEEHDNYAPCSVLELVSRGYDYWALGHVHNRAVLHESPWVVYPGNLQGRHVRETGPKGCTLITVEDGRITGLEHRSVDRVRWARLVVDAGAMRSEDELLAAVEESLAAAREEAEDRPLIARVVVEGATVLHGRLAAAPERFAADVEAMAIRTGDVWIERVKLSTRLLDRGAAGGLHALVRSELEALSREEALAPYLETLSPLAKAVGRFVDEKPDRPEFVGGLLPELEAMLLGRLASADEEEA